MTATASGGAVSAGFGNQRTIDVINGVSCRFLTNFTSGGVPASALLALSKGIPDIANANFVVGSNGPDGIASNDAIGRAAIFFSPAAFLRDLFFTMPMTVRLVRPTIDFVDPFAVW